MSAEIQKKVTATERRSLEKLLDEDFNLLSGDLHRMAEEAKEAVRKTANEAAKVRKAQARKLEDKIRTIIRDAADDGFVTTYSSHNLGFTIEDDELQKRINEGVAVVIAEHAAARTVLHRKRHETRRNLLTATLSEEALGLLGAIPSAENVMLEAIETRQSKALTK